MMDLNNNPRVDAEKRHSQLIARRDRIWRYKYSAFSIDRENGMAARMLINPYIKTRKASRLLDLLNKEIRKVEKELKRWR